MVTLGKGGSAVNETGSLLFWTFLSLVNPRIDAATAPAAPSSSRLPSPPHRFVPFFSSLFLNPEGARRRRHLPRKHPVPSYANSQK